MDARPGTRPLARHLDDARCRHRADRLRSGTCWGTERVAGYFARTTCNERGGSHLLPGVRLDGLDPAKLRIDPVMIEFPIFPEYDERQYEWEEASSRKWVECLRLYESVTYRAVVPWALLVRS